jgi:hypothetical protein
MTAKKSLAGVSIANRILERHDTSMSGGPILDRPGPDYVIFVHPTFNMRFIGRFCTIKDKRSGGYVLKAALNERYSHESGLIRCNAIRLKPGWTREHLFRACHREFIRLSEERTIKRHREQVYLLAESRDFDTDRIDTIAEAEGREIAYSDMTLADCEFWKTELAKFPQKKKSA